MPQSQVHNTDCIQFMQSLPDNFFSLAIADPPYGDAGQNNTNPHVEEFMTLITDYLNNR